MGHICTHPICCCLRKSAVCDVSSEPDRADACLFTGGCRLLGTPAKAGLWLGSNNGMVLASETTESILMMLQPVALTDSDRLVHWQSCWCCCGSAALTQLVRNFNSSYN